MVTRCLYGVEQDPCSRCNLHTELQAGITSLMHMFMIWEHGYEVRYFCIQVFWTSAGILNVMLQF